MVHEYLRLKAYSSWFTFDDKVWWNFGKWAPCEHEILEESISPLWPDYQTGGTRQRLNVLTCCSSVAVREVYIQLWHPGFNYLLFPKVSYSAWIFSVNFSTSNFTCCILTINVCFKNDLTNMWHYCVQFSCSWWRILTIPQHVICISFWLCNNK